jgi:hypothetical protein
VRAWLGQEDFLEALVRLAYAKALPTDAEIRQAGCKHAGDFLAALAEEAAVSAAFHRARTRRYDDGVPLEQPLGHKVRHLCEWIVYRARGGLDSEKPLTKKDAELLRDGKVQVSHAQVVRESDETMAELLMDDVRAAEAAEAQEQLLSEELELVRAGADGPQKEFES